MKLDRRERKDGIQRILSIFQLTLVRYLAPTPGISMSPTDMWFRCTRLTWATFITTILRRFLESINLYRWAVIRWVFFAHSGGWALSSVFVRVSQSWPGFSSNVRFLWWRPRFRVGIGPPIHSYLVYDSCFRQSLLFSFLALVGPAFLIFRLFFFRDSLSHTHQRWF